MERKKGVQCTRREVVLAILFGALAVLIALIAFANSAQTGEESGGISQAVTRWANGVLAWLGLKGGISEYAVRKLAHFGEYTLLGLCLLLCVRAGLGRLWKLLPIPLLVGLLVAVVDETIQLSVEGRSGQFSDVLLDFSGVIAGTALGLLIVRLTWGRVARKGKKVKRA